MLDLKLTDNVFDPNGYWSKPMEKLVYLPCPEDVYLFDQTGYDLTVLERHFHGSNVGNFGPHRYSLRKEWIVQERDKIEGAVLNHSFIFERKAYTGAALEQLKQWAKKLPLVYKIIAMRPKWGLDFSMDYVDRKGNAFEILHWEWDSFDYEEIQFRKLKYQAMLVTTDWDDAAHRLLQHKDEWFPLEYFEQSAWKCKYFGIENERFKMVIWQ